MRRAVLCAGLAAALLPSSTGAQSLNLTESEALARLSPESPRARAARALIDIARVDVLTAARWPNPRVTYDRESVAGVTEHIAMMAQPLPITGRRGLEVQAASALVSASSSRVDEEMRRLRADLRQAFAALYAAQVRERELTATRDRLRDLAGIFAKREAVGEGAGFDRLRAEHEVLDVETDIVVASTDRARAQATMASFFSDLSDPSQIMAAGAPASVPADVPSVDALLESAESSRGELAALRHEVEAAEFAARAAKRRVVPEPEIVAGTKSSTVGTGDIGSIIAVHATIPLFDRARPELALAAARAARAQAQMEAFRTVLRGQISGLRAAVIERNRAAERYRAEAVGSAAQIERIAQISYDAGERSILELLDAYRLGSTARTRQAALDAAVIEAEIELEFASGWEIRQ